MIACVGESLVDFTPVTVAGRLDGFRVRPGGSPCNVAVGVARLGHESGFAGRMSDDLFGRMLAAHLVENGVATHLAPRGREPTALAFVAGAEGEAAYDFRLVGTAAAGLAPGDLSLERFADLEAVHFGSLGVAVRPSREAVLGLARALRGGPLLTFDPNVRPEVVPDWPEYRAALAEAAELADLVRASEADLRAWGVRPELGHDQALIVTAGPAGSRLHLAGRTVTCPAAPCRVVDTVGAGDAYMAALLVALAERRALDRAALGRLGDDDWLAVIRFAAVAAALTCERTGADPPARAEVDARLAAWSSAG
ncbi:MAG TPA: carbohydrate kinase [Terriglobales bacterium]|nr:carbohydrate kinase [Terriglobales bacterium]